MKYFYQLFFIFLGTLPLFFFASLLFLKDPLVWPDEAIYLDTAKTLSQTGRLATNIFGTAIPGLEQHSHWYPPLYFHLLSLWIKIFGSTIESIRWLSLLLAFFTLIIFFFTAQLITKDEQFISTPFKESPKEQVARQIGRDRIWSNDYTSGFNISLLAVLLLVFDFSFSRASRVARMDMFNFFLSTVSLFFLFLGLKNETQEFKKNFFFYLLAGIFSGLAVITHPLGFIAPVTAITYLLFILIAHFSNIFEDGRTKDLKKIFLNLALILIPVFLFLFLWLFSMKDSFDLFLKQYHLQFLRKAPQAPFVFEMWRSNHWWKVLFSLYGLITLLLFLNPFVDNQPKEKKVNLLLFLGITVSTVAILWGKEMWYPLYFQPFISLAFIFLLKNGGRLAKKIILVGMIFYFLAHINLFLTIVQQLGSDSYDYHQFSKSIAEKLPEKATVFLATIPDPYFDLTRLKKNLQFYEFPTVPISDAAYKKLLDTSDYLILNMMPDKRIEDYMNKNLEEKIVVGESGQFLTTIFKLMPRNKRL